MRLSFTVEGTKDVLANFKKLAQQYPGAFGAALYGEGMRVWNAAVKKAPVEFGVMRNSAYVAPPTISGSSVSVEIGFGTKYAPYQHEGENLRHPRGGESKFLEKAVTEVKAGFLERVSAQTQRNVENGVSAPALGAPARPKSGGVRRRGTGRLASASRRAGSRRRK